MLEEQPLIRHVQGLIARRVLPEIEKLFFMKVTRMERYMVGCYSRRGRRPLPPAPRQFLGRDGAPPLRGVDQPQRRLRRRRGQSFPEYNPRGIKAPPGWAVVFPANILHAVEQGDARAPLRLPALRLRRGGRRDPRPPTWRPNRPPPRPPAAAAAE